MVIKADVVLGETDWDGIPTPVVVDRNVTVKAERSLLPYRWLFNLNWVSSKVLLGDGVVVRGQELLLTNYRLGALNQAPGLDLFVSSRPNTTALLHLVDCLVVLRVCYPASLLGLSFSQAPRPANIPGVQAYQAVVDQTGCSTDPMASLAERCWPLRGSYDDFGMPCADLNAYGRTLYTRYNLHLLRTSFVCERVLTDGCITELGPLGCSYWTYAQLDPPWLAFRSSLVSPPPDAPPPASLSGGVTGQQPGTASPADSEPLQSGSEGRSPPAARKKQMPSGAEAAAGGGGAAGGEGEAAAQRPTVRSPALLAGAITGCLGALALGLTAVGVLLWRRKRRQLQRAGTDDKDMSASRHSARKPFVVNGKDGKDDLTGSGSTSASATCSRSQEGECRVAMQLAAPAAVAISVGEPGELVVAAPAGATAPQSQLLASDLGACCQHAAATAVATNDGLRTDAVPLAAGSALLQPGKVLEVKPVAAAAAAAAPDASAVITWQTPPHPDVNLALSGLCVSASVGCPSGTTATTSETTAAAAVAGKEPSARDPCAQRPGESELAGNEQLELGHCVGGSDASRCSGSSLPLDPDADRVELTPLVLGRGAYGRVVEGRYRGAAVAVKLLAEGLVVSPPPPSALYGSGDGISDGSGGGTAASSFSAEAAVLARCRHPNVVRLLAACLAPPRPCLVLERCDTSLAALMREAPGGLLPLEAVLHVALDVARGLEYLHPTVMHRDIKPANVLVNDPLGPNMVAKLSDFGLSRLCSSVLLTQNPEAGTPTYTAPECFDLHTIAITHRADMYSLGMLLWGMLSGKEAWQGLNAVQLAYRVTCLRERPPLSAIPPGRCPPKLARLVEACWDADPQRRPAAAEVVKQLLLLRQIGARRQWEEPAIAEKPEAWAVAGAAAPRAGRDAGSAEAELQRLQQQGPGELREERQLLLLLQETETASAGKADLERAADGVGSQTTRPAPEAEPKPASVLLRRSAGDSDSKQGGRAAAHIGHDVTQQTAFAMDGSVHGANGYGDGPCGLVGGVDVGASTTTWASARSDGWALGGATSP